MFEQATELHLHDFMPAYITDMRARRFESFGKVVVTPAEVLPGRVDTTLSDWLDALPTSLVGGGQQPGAVLLSNMALSMQVWPAG
jgi:hypothetical protein